MSQASIASQDCDPGEVALRRSLRDFESKAADLYFLLNPTNTNTLRNVVEGCTGMKDSLHTSLADCKKLKTAWKERINDPGGYVAGLDIMRMSFDKKRIGKQK